MLQYTHSDTVPCAVLHPHYERVEQVEIEFRGQRWHEHGGFHTPAGGFFEIRRELLLSEGELFLGRTHCRRLHTDLDNVGGGKALRDSDKRFQLAAMLERKDYVGASDIHQVVVQSLTIDATDKSSRVHNDQPTARAPRTVNKFAGSRNKGKKMFSPY